MKLPGPNVADRAQQAIAIRRATGFTTRELVVITALVTIIGLATFTRFWRLGTPAECYFDEVYYATTSAEILRGDPRAWEFFGHENTHPPLSKLFMAAGQGLFGHDSGTADNKCWGDAEDAQKRTDPAWRYLPFGWRFFGALAGVGAVLFIFLIGKKVFNEWVGLIAAFLLTVEGLAFTQARIATPDTYVVFFILGALYFLLSDRFLLSGILFGAAFACKFTALFTVMPIALYLLFRYRTYAQSREGKIVYLAPLSLLAFYLGTVFVFGELLVHRTDAGLAPSFPAGIFTAGLILWMGLAALTPLAGYAVYRLFFRKQGEVPTRFSLAEPLVVTVLFFIAVPLYIYFLTYIPMLANNHGIKDVIELQKMMYTFHSSDPVVAGPQATHAYSSPWDTWPILMRPVFLYVVDYAKIYNLGNPIIFWAGLPALGFTLWQGLRGLRAHIDFTGRLIVNGVIERRHFLLLFVVLTFLAFWLTWARQPRLMFLYHYLNALPFLILALAYTVYRVWQEPWERIGPWIASFAAPSAAMFFGFAAFFHALASRGVIEKSNENWARPFLALGLASLLIFGLSYWIERRWGQPAGRTIATGFLVICAATFVYFYPHLAAWNVSPTHDGTFFWFDSWR